MKHPRSWLAAHGEVRLSSAAARQFTQAISRRKNGWPLAYIIKQRNFYDLEIPVSPAVLIPRPATETIIDFLIKQIAHDRRVRTVADIGTGSGAIALVLSRHCPHLRVLATDISSAALRMARSNARRYSLAKSISFFHGDLIEPLDHESPIDVIVANLPYLTSDQITGPLRYEPRQALVGGPKGTEIIQRLLRQLKARPRYLGLVLELQSQQYRPVANIIRRQWPSMSIARIKAGRTTVGICAWDKDRTVST